MRLSVTVDLQDEKVRFSGTAALFLLISADYFPPLGDGAGYTGLEALLLSLAVCSATSVVSLLAHTAQVQPPSGSTRQGRAASSLRLGSRASGSSSPDLPGRHGRRPAKGGPDVGSVALPGMGHAEGQRGDRLRVQAHRPLILLPAGARPDAAVQG
jgi:hypothetical protein